MNFQDNLVIDDEIDEMAGYDTETLEEYEEDRCLDIVDEFKQALKMEPEFYGIDYISSFEILNFTYMDHMFTKHHYLTDSQLELFDSMFMSIYNYSSTESNYNFIANKIFSRIYVI